MNNYWHVDDLRKFNNVMIHQLQGDIKYLCCLNCQSSIIGYQIISQPEQIFVSCDRVKLENEVDEDEEAEDAEDGVHQNGGGQYQDEFGVQDNYGQEMDPNEMQEYTPEQIAQMQAYQQQMAAQQQMQMQEEGAVDYGQEQMVPEGQGDEGYYQEDDGQEQQMWADEVGKARRGVVWTP